MPKPALPLLILGRFFAVGAIVLAFGAGFLQAWFGAAFVCFDTCPEPTSFFPTEGPKAINLMIPCVAFALVALAFFVLYCLVMKQPKRALKQAIALVVGGAIGVIALNLILAFGQAHVALKSDGAGNTYFDEGSLVAWESLWGLALMAVVGAWSIFLARLQWRR